MSLSNTYWLWYPGDFELYHAMEQNFSRVERGVGWPAFWKSEGFRSRIAFHREYTLDRPTVFTVYGVSGSQGYVRLDEKKYPFGKPVSCAAGEHSIAVHIGCIGCMPSVYIEGEVIRSDDGWTVKDFEHLPVRAAFNRYFTDRERDPSEWAYREKIYEPLAEESVGGGVLYSFETEMTASLEVLGDACPTVYLGESRAEALDTENCYFFCDVNAETRRCPRQALRYAYIPGCVPGQYRVRAIHQYIDIPVKAGFRCDDEELNRIFEVAAYTFSLCSGAFLIDGIKRDKWIWGGDAYQSLFVNRYLTGDADVERRTLLALRGNDPVTTHINTILDYSLLWILSIEVYYESYGDEAFLREIWPKMESLMALCMSQREEHGFVTGRQQDWVFVDWADFDRDGPLCAEQMLLAESYRVMARFAADDRRCFYQRERESLLAQIEKCYWDPEKEAYVDSFTSGRAHVTRHANIFAVLFSIADEERKRQIACSVLLNDRIPAITTPYFRFFELEALCQLGEREYVLREIKNYWGGMLKLGAVTFWEQFDPALPLEQQYAMYRDPYGKSLCHAWAASPIYLLARYFVGLKPLKAGGEEYEAAPAERFFSELECVFPMGGRQIQIRLEDGKLSVAES